MATPADPKAVLRTRRYAVLLVFAAGAYAISLGTFRGGPTFPAMFLGAAAGAALSHISGLPLVAGAAMGIEAFAAVILTLPLTSVLIATLVLGSDGITVMPLVIVAVVVAHVAREWFVPRPASQTAPAPAAAGVPQR
jgi:H+/Cl- antiporter ClcA